MDVSEWPQNISLLNSDAGLKATDQFLNPQKTLIWVIIVHPREVIACATLMRDSVQLHMLAAVIILLKRRRLSINHIDAYSADASDRHDFGSSFWTAISEEIGVGLVDALNKVRSGYANSSVAGDTRSV